MQMEKKTLKIQTADVFLFVTAVRAFQTLCTCEQSFTVNQCVFQTFPSLALITVITDSNVLAQLAEVYVVVFPSCFVQP